MNEEHATWDVVVVGAGVTGALVAWRLARAGRRVLVLEAGPERDRAEMVRAFAQAAEKTPDAPYQGTLADREAPSPRVLDKADSGHYRQRGPDMFKSTYQRLVGGSTWHWLGNVPRFIPSDFRLYTVHGVGVDWPLSYDDLEPWYVEAERELGVSGDHEEWDGALGARRSQPFPMPPIWPAYGDRIVARSLHGAIVDGRCVELRVTPQARNSTPYQGRPSCAGNSSCIPICPIGAKYDATVHVELARRASCHPGGVDACVLYRAVVKRLEADDAGRILRVHYECWTPDGASRTKHTVSAGTYVVAAHAIESALLLLESGLARSGPVGRNLMDHLQGYGGAILPEPVYPFRGPPVVSGIDAWRDGAFRREHAAFRFSVGNDGWGRLEPLEEVVRRQIYDEDLLGAALRDAVNHRATRMLRMSFSTEMLPDPENRVTVGGRDDRGNPRPELHFRWSAYNDRAFKCANWILTELFRRLGATEPPQLSHPRSKYSGAGHIVGTCRMGAHASDSVVDVSGRVHEHPNLFLVGASTFPTSGTANPTLTAAALALRTAAILQAETP